VITAREKGRQLELIVGGGEDALTFLVPPIPAAAGSQLLADWIGVAFAAQTGEEAENTVRNLAQTALGEDNYHAIQDLRWGEQQDLVNAAFMWNVQGGGIDLVNEYLSGGLPKARETLLKAVGLWDAFSLLQTSLSSALENLTSTADSPDTTTPSGGETPSE